MSDLSITTRIIDKASPYTLDTPQRLAAWRAYHYRQGEAIPPNWFKRAHECTVIRDERGDKIHFGDGLGVDNERNIPFRFTGYADQVVRLNHTGWYADRHGDTVYRGIVVQIPARNGREQYLAGRAWGEGTRAHSFSMGGGYLDISRGSIHDTKEDAARAADEIARIDAERDREALEQEEREEAERLEQEEQEEAETIADDLDVE